MEYVAVVALIGVALVLMLSLVGQATGNAYKQTAATVSHQASHGYGSAGGGGGYSGSPYIPASNKPNRRPPSDSSSSSDPSGDLSAKQAGR